MVVGGLCMLRMNLRMKNNMQKSILSGLESIFSALYSSGRYLLMLGLSIAAAWFSEIYYDAHVVVMALCLYFTAVGVSATAFVNWLFGGKR